MNWYNLLNKNVKSAQIYPIIKDTSLPNNQEENTSQKPLPDIETQLKQFISGQKRNAWLDDDKGTKVYVRKGKHYINGTSYTMLDIPNIDILDKGNGIFTSFLTLAEQIQPWQGVFVENLHNARLADFLRRRGYSVNYSSGDNTLPSFYKLK